ncbi:MAG TPA: transcriptional regulator NrdR [Lentisphaeria bacterium]|nr:transcriptional regulator NrdR [Lentisphaeria bacterium]
MRCPKCGMTDDKVIETRAPREGDAIRRRRLCLSCNYRFTTYETIIPADIYVVKRDGRREEFQPNKLRDGIRMACWKRSIDEATIDSVVADITTRLSLLPQNEVESQYIGELAMKLLKKVDEVAYVRFASVYRHFQDADAFIDEVQSMQAENKASEPEGNHSQETPANKAGEDGKTA